jgi:hypothetical protein
VNDVNRPKECAAMKRAIGYAACGLLASLMFAAIFLALGGCVASLLNDVPGGIAVCVLAGGAVCLACLVGEDLVRDWAGLRE